MEAGAILFHTDFTFHDGSRGKKLLILLNTPDLSKNEPFLLIRTTSQLKGRQMQPGCIAAWRLFYIPHIEVEFFTTPTLLQLDYIYELNPQIFIQNGLDKKLSHKGNLSTETFGQLKNCIKHIKEDISEKHYKLIFRK
jgi:hypothetical protein